MFESDRFPPLHHHLPLSNLRSRGFKMLILSTLKPWGASRTSEAHLSWVPCHSIIKQTGTTSPNTSANLLPVIPKLMPMLASIQLQKLVLHQPPFSHLPLEMHKARNTHFNASTHTYSCLCLHGVWVIGHNLIKWINKLWAVMSRGVRSNKHIRGWAVYLCEDNCADPLPGERLFQGSSLLFMLPR